MKTPALDALQARKTAFLNPVHSLAAMGAGAVLGGGVGYMSGDKEHPIADALQGAVSGAGAAALLDHAADMHYRPRPSTDPVHGPGYTFPPETEQHLQNFRAAELRRQRLNAETAEAQQYIPLQPRTPVSSPTVP